MISVLCPSRGRPELLARSLESLRGLAASPYLVEYLVMYDPDDAVTADVALAAGALVFEAPERYGYRNLGEYYNRLAELATGSWLLLWNDDAVMTTPGWNLIIENLPQHVLVADLHTGLSAMGVCAFPAVRIRAVERLGYFCPPETSHTDSFWQDVGRLTGTIAPVPVHVHHDRFDLTGNNDDQTYQESRGQYRTEEYYGPVVQARLRHDAERLMAAHGG